MTASEFFDNYFSYFFWEAILILGDFLGKMGDCEFLAIEFWKKLKFGKKHVNFGKIVNSGKIVNF